MIRKSRAIQALKISETLLMYEIHGKVHDPIQERPQTRKETGKCVPWHGRTVLHFVRPIGSSCDLFDFAFLTLSQFPLGLFFLVSMHSTAHPSSFIIVFEVETCIGLV